jgi:uncharacterized protein (TIGR02328 family)
MRLWHYKLLPYLPGKQLMGQWRECLALLGNGWGRKHSTVDYIFKYEKTHLLAYTMLVVNEAIGRNYHCNMALIVKQLAKNHTDEEIQNIDYFGQQLANRVAKDKEVLYLEHDEKYLMDCLLNLVGKGTTPYQYENWQEIFKKENS